MKGIRPYLSKGIYGKPPLLLLALFFVVFSLLPICSSAEAECYTFYYNNYYNDENAGNDCVNEWKSYLYCEETCSITFIDEGRRQTAPNGYIPCELRGLKAEGDEGFSRCSGLGVQCLGDLVCVPGRGNCNPEESLRPLALKEWSLRVSLLGDAELRCDGVDDNCNQVEDEICEFSPCQPEVGSTANMASGNLQHTQTLFAIPDARLPLEFALTYNSIDGSGPLGNGWRHPFMVRITANAQPIDSYMLHQGHGRNVILQWDGTHYTPENGAYPQLVINPDSSATLSWKDGTAFIFGTDSTLSRIEDRKGNAITLTYTDNNLTGITDPAGRAVILNYNVDNLIESITDPAGNLHTFTYTLDSGSGRYNLSGISTLTPAPDSRTLAWSYTYVNAGFMRTKTDPMGYTTQYIPDAFYRPKQTIDHEGKVRDISYPYIDKSLQQTTYSTTILERDSGLWSYTYDITTGKLLQRSDPDGNTTKYTYYPNGNLQTVIAPSDPDRPDWVYPTDYTTTYTWDAQDNVSTVTEPGDQVTTYTWTADNQIDTFTDPEGNVWDYDYYANGDLKSITEPSEHDPQGVTTTYTYDYSPDGNIQNRYTTNPAQQTTTYSYDPNGNLTSITDHLNAVITITSFPSGAIESISDPRNPNYKYFFEFDSLNQLVKITDPKSNETLFGYDLKGNLTSVTDANTNPTYYDYNHENQLIEIKDALNNLTTLNYGGTGCASCGDGGSNLVSFIDGNSKETQFTNYQTGKRETQTDPLGNMISFAYTPRGQLKTLTDPATSATRFSYTKQGQVETITDALNRVTSFTYTGTKKVATRTDRKDDTTTYTYTPDGKLDTITYQDTSSVNVDYDVIDRPVLMQDLIGDTTYLYDDPNRTVTVTDPNGFPVTYKYDAAGNLIELTYPGNKTVSYEYDELNRLWKVTNWLNQTATYTYDPAGRLERTDNFNGTYTVYAYDDADRLVALENRRADDTIIATYLFTLDGVGNRTESIREEPLATTLNDEMTDYTYNTEKNRLLTAGVTGFTYDFEGQIASKDSDTYSFDYEHRLSGMTGSVNATFSYDGRWSRLKAERNGVITYYIYDLNGNVLAEADASQTITKYYIHGLGLMAMVTAPLDNIYTYHFNQIGSTVAVTDANQNIVNMYAYSPFGLIANESETIAQPFKYVGQFGVMAEPNSFYYMRARYYDPNVGRFVSEDPIGFAGGTVNLYEYVKNSPVNWIDPMGLEGGLAGDFGTMVGTPNPNPSIAELNQALAITLSPFALIAGYAAFVAPSSTYLTISTFISITSTLVATITDPCGNTGARLTLDAFAIIASGMVYPVGAMVLTYNLFYDFVLPYLPEQPVVYGSDPNWGP